MINGWKWKKSITVSRASGAVTNYQMMFKIYYGSGADGSEAVEGITAAKVYCDSKCNTDFSDIRFTNSAGTLLSHWLEVKSDSNYAVFWVKLDSIGTGATTFYVYYGNDGAADASDGENTFIAFEDFEWGSDGDDLNTSGGSMTWTKHQGVEEIDTARKWGGTRSGKLPGAATFPHYYSSWDGISIDNNIAVRLRYYKEDAVKNAPNFHLGNGAKHAGFYIENDESIRAPDTDDTGLNCTPDQWELIEIYNLDWTAGTFSLILNGTDTAIGEDMAAAIYTGLRVINADTDVGEDAWIDNIVIRNYRSTAPAWGSWGAEEHVSQAQYLYGAIELRALESFRYLLGNMELVEGSAQYLRGLLGIVEGGCQYLYGKAEVINGGSDYLLVVPTIVSRIPKSIYGRHYQRLSVTEKEVS